MKFKKLISVLLISAMTLGCLAGCGKEESQSTDRSQSGADDYDYLEDDIEDDGNDETEVVSKTGGSVEDYPGNQGDSFTLMVYFCGADLESEYGCATSDINEILYADYGEEVNVVLQTGGSSQWQNDIISSDVVERYTASPYDGLVCVEEVGDVPMLSEDTLSDFISWAAENYPADRYGLILWDHGGGTMSGYGVDENNPDDEGISIAGVGNAIGDSGVHLSFVGFDACLMGTVETANMMAPYADFLLASEETEPGGGWYYTNFLSMLGSDPGVSIPAMAMNIIDDFNDDTYSDTSSGVTLSVIDLSYVPMLDEALNNFYAEADQMIQNGNYNSIAKARSEALSFGDDSFDQIDLVDFAERTGASSASDLAEAVDAAVVYSNTNMSGANGLAVYFPYLLVESYSDTMSYLEGCDLSNAEYENFYNDFVSVMTYGHTSGGGNDNPYGYSQDNYADVSDEDWYNSDVEQYTDTTYIDTEELVLTEKDDHYALQLSDEEWDLVTTIYLQAYVDDGEGYLELGYDDRYEFDDEGDMIAEYDYNWLYIDDCLVPFYAEDRGEYSDGTTYSYGYVPCTLNDDEDIELMIYWYDNDGPVVEGYRYPSGSSQMASRGYYQLKDGDYLDFYFDYYTYDNEYEASYMLSNNTYYYNGGKVNVSYDTIGDVATEVCFYLQDIYQNNYWTETIRYE